MTEVIDHGHSFISHPSTMVPTYGAGRGHKGHRVLIWIAEGAIQIKLLSSYRWKFAPTGAEHLA
jgi:hypothetical protein